MGIESFVFCFISFSQQQYRITQFCGFLLSLQTCGFFLNRSIVLMATRGQPEDLVDVAPYLVTVFGMAKTADLHSKGWWCTYLLSRYYLLRQYFFFSYCTLIAASYHRESGTLGVPQNPQQGSFTSPMDFPTNRTGGWIPGAAGAIPPPWFGDKWLYTTCSSNTQRPGATQKGHGTIMTNVNYTNYLAKHSCAQIHRHT